MGRNRTKMKGRLSQNKRTVLWVLLSFSSLLLLWQAASLFSQGRLQIPPPLTVFQAFFRAFVVPIGKNTIQEHAAISLWRVLLGFSVASVIGMAIGILMGLSEPARAVLQPVFEFVRPIPPIAWIPLSILWFGLGSANKIFIIFIASFTYVTINSYEGARNVDPQLIGAGPVSLRTSSFPPPFPISLPACKYPWGSAGPRRWPPRSSIPRAAWDGSSPWG